MNDFQQISNTAILITPWKCNFLKVEVNIYWEELSSLSRDSIASEMLSDLPTCFAANAGTMSPANQWGGESRTVEHENQWGFIATISSEKNRPHLQPLSAQVFIDRHSMEMIKCDSGSICRSPNEVTVISDAMVLIIRWGRLKFQHPVANDNNTIIWHEKPIFLAFLNRSSLVRYILHWVITGLEIRNQSYLLEVGNQSYLFAKAVSLNCRNLKSCNLFTHAYLFVLR